MAEWEYMQVNTQELEKIASDAGKRYGTGLNVLGLRGWEAYAVIERDYWTYFLKRQIE